MPVGASVFSLGAQHKGMKEASATASAFATVQCEMTESLLKGRALLVDRVFANIRSEAERRTKNDLLTEA